MNGRMGNKTLEEKIPVLESNIKLNEKILEDIEYIIQEIEVETDTMEEDENSSFQEVQVPVWNRETIETRTRNLCEKALEKCWSI